MANGIICGISCDGRTLSKPTNVVNVSVVPHKIVNVCSTKLHEKMAKLIGMFEYFAKVIYLCGL
jgi:hypothetical protein